MKKLIPLLFLLSVVFSFTLFAQQADASSSLVKVVNTKSAIIRAEANSSSEKLVTLTKGSYVTQLSSSNGWAKVQAGKTTGYLQLTTLKVKDFNRKVLKKSTAVQQVASKNATTLGKYSTGYVVQNYGTASNGWSFVKIGDTTGYVPTANLKATGSTIKYLTSTSDMYNLPGKGSFIKTINENTKVSVLSTVGNYAYVKTGSSYGYVPTANLVMYMAFANAYVPKCANVKTSTIKCTASKSNTFVYKNSGDTWDDVLGRYEIKGTKLIVTFYEGAAEIDFPLYKGKTWSYDFYVDDWDYCKVISVNETVRYKGKTLKQVIKIENYNSYSGYYYTYLAPGYGFINL